MAFMTHSFWFSMRCSEAKKSNSDTYGGTSLEREDRRVSAGRRSVARPFANTQTPALE